MKKIIVIITMIAFFAASAEAFAAEITLRDSATVGHGYVRMADIVTVSGFESATTEKINSIFCGSSPEPDAQRTIDRAYVKMRLAQNNISLFGIKFSGAEEIAVNSAAVIVINWPEDKRPATAETPAPVVRRASTMQEKYLERIPKELAAKEALNPADYSVTIASISSALKLAPSNSKMQEFAQVGSRGNSSTVIFRVKLLDAEKKSHEGIVVARIKIMLPVVVVKRDMKADERIAAEDVEIVRMPITGGRNHYFVDVDKVVGMALECDIKKGVAVLSTKAELPIVVKKGDVVKLISRIAGKNISVETTAVIQSNGKVGETIKVKNVASGEALMARVVNGKTVEIIVGESK